MRFKKLDLNLLAALDTLIRTCSVSRAAEEMYLTQSAMSNALARLRDHFGDPLLVQAGRRMELTPLAETLRDPLREIMARIEMAMETTPHFSPATSTRCIGIVLSDYTLYALIPSLPRYIAREAPGITLDLKPQHMQPYVLLEQGQADLLIVPEMYCSPQHPTELLIEDPLCCLVAAESAHPAQRFTIEEFSAAGHVVMQPPAKSESYAALACREAGLVLRVAISTFAFTSIGDLVIGSQRIAVVQERLARRLIDEKGGLRIVEPPLPLRPMRQMLQWHRARAHDPALSWMRDAIIALSKSG